ncbi:MAG: hypothetical protein HY514_01535 [Candidatus Aenigmarchaeota archaeon]|nr:hypothetical protein [Candidatus Aenigmarchaeota archaeon]
MEDIELDKIRTYQPGKCNIGNTNRFFRFSYGFFFLALSVYLWIGFSVHDFGIIAKAILFIPLYVGFLGVYQALLRFCVYHAKRRTYDMR